MWGLSYGWGALALGIVIAAGLAPGGQAAPAGGGGGAAAADGVAVPLDLSGSWAWGAGEPPGGSDAACDAGTALELRQAGPAVAATSTACEADDCWPAEQLAGRRTGDRLALAGWAAGAPGTAAPAIRVRYELAWDAQTAQWRGTRNGEPVWLTPRAGCP